MARQAHEGLDFLRHQKSVLIVTPQKEFVLVPVVGPDFAVTDTTLDRLGRCAFASVRLHSRSEASGEDRKPAFREFTAPRGL